jgi:hypothetical protein
VLPQSLDMLVHRGSQTLCLLANIVATLHQADHTPSPRGLWLRDGAQELRDRHQIRGGGRRRGEGYRVSGPAVIGCSESKVSTKRIRLVTIKASCNRGRQESIGMVSERQEVRRGGPEMIKSSGSNLSMFGMMTSVRALRNPLEPQRGGGGAEL